MGGWTLPPSSVFSTVGSNRSPDSSTSAAAWPCIGGYKYHKWYIYIYALYCMHNKCINPGLAVICFEHIIYRTYYRISLLTLKSPEPNPLSIFQSPGITFIQRIHSFKTLTCICFALTWQASPVEVCWWLSTRDFLVDSFSEYSTK